MTGNGQEDIYQCLQSTRIIREMSIWETKAYHWKSCYHYPVKLSKLLLLCYLVCKKANKLRKLTHNAKNTWPCAFPVYSSTGQSSGFVAADKQTKPAQPLLSQPQPAAFNTLREERGTPSFWWEKPETHVVLQMPVLKGFSFKQLQPPQILQAV